MRQALPLAISTRHNIASGHGCAAHSVTIQRLQPQCVLQLYPFSNLASIESFSRPPLHETPGQYAGHGNFQLGGRLYRLPRCEQISRLIAWYCTGKELGITLYNLAIQHIQRVLAIDAWNMETVS